MLERLRGWKVGIGSYQEPWIDTTPPFGDAMLGITAVWAQLERAILRARVRAGMERARRGGSGWDGRESRKRRECGATCQWCVSGSRRGRSAAGRRRGFCASRSRACAACRLGATDKCWGCGLLIQEIPRVKTALGVPGLPQPSAGRLPIGPDPVEWTVQVSLASHETRRSVSTGFFRAVTCRAAGVDPTLPTRRRPPPPVCRHRTSTRYRHLLRIGDCAALPPC